MMSLFVAYSLANSDGTLKDLDRYVSAVWVQTSTADPPKYYNGTNCIDTFERDTITELFYGQIKG